jgi:aspartate racemase
VKTVGIIGGIGPESTIEYYRLIIAEYRRRQLDGSYPSIIVNSIDLSKMIDLITANELEQLTVDLATEIQRLAMANASFGVLASNTPHIVFDDLSRKSPIPLISIVKATCAAMAERGLKRLGLFGSRFTMEGRFYPDVFSIADIAIVAPNTDEREYIHRKYMSELINGVLLPETREHLLSIVDRLRERDDIDGLILGGTELPLILKQNEHNGIPFLDTTRIHVERIVTEMLS